MSAGITHEEAFELLPWLANGRLEPDERARVERHLRECLVCHAELKSQRALRVLVAEQPTVDLSAERGFDALLARLDAPAAPVGARAGARRRRRRRQAAALITGSAAALAAVLSVVVWLGAGGPRADDPAAYSVLGQPAAGGGALIDIVFAPDVSETALRALLREIGGTIVAGPSELGRYTVRAAATPAERDALLDRLRADARVRFAGPAFVTAPREVPE